MPHETDGGTEVESGETAPGQVERESTMSELFGPLPDWEFRLWPSSTQVIMASLFLALGFIVAMQIAERLDTAMFGGVAPIWGTILFTPWLLAGGMFFGLTGALIVANINPIVANLTATSPLAPLFFVANTLFGVTIALLVWYFKEPGEGIRFSQVLVAVAIAGALNIIPYTFFQRIVLEFQWEVIAGLFALQFVVFLVSVVIAYPFCKKLLEAEVIQTY